MKNRVIQGVLLAFTMSLIVACDAKKTEPAAVIDAEQIKKEIQAKEDEFAATYNAGEMKSYWLLC